MELTLTLKAVMQSYGGNNPWTATRQTETQPTESAIKGIVECAMGLAKAGVDPDDDAVRKDLWEHVSIDVTNIDHIPNILIDTQTVHELTDDMHFVCAGGGSMAGRMPVVSKEYLVDETYTVTLRGDDKYIADIKEYLQHPIYPYAYGRACCSPSVPIVLNN